MKSTPHTPVPGNDRPAVSAAPPPGGSLRVAACELSFIDGEMRVLLRLALGREETPRPRRVPPRPTKKSKP